MVSSYGEYGITSWYSTLQVHVDYLHYYPFYCELLLWVSFLIATAMQASYMYRTLAKEGPLRNVRPPPDFGSISC